MYFVSLLGGSLGALIISPDALTVGASGAIFGLMGAVLALGRSRGISIRNSPVLGVLVINLLLTFGLSSSSRSAATSAASSPASSPAWSSSSSRPASRSDRTPAPRSRPWPRPPGPRTRRPRRWRSALLVGGIVAANAAAVI